VSGSKTPLADELMAKDPTVYEFVNLDEAKRRIRRAKPGTWFWVEVGQFAPKKGQRYTTEGTIIGFKVHNIVRVSRRAAIAFIEDCYGYRRDTVDIQLGQSSRAFFIGRGYH
jgi:hypothetical protein